MTFGETVRYIGRQTGRAAVGVTRPYFRNWRYTIPMTAGLAAGIGAYYAADGLYEVQGIDHDLLRLGISVPTGLGVTVGLKRLMKGSER